MYYVLDKDTIKTHILPFLDTAKRGFKTKSCLMEIVNCIFYKLKSGCQWHMLPVKALFSEVTLSYKTVFAHYRKWSKNGNWKDVWKNYLRVNKPILDLSSMDLDGSHSTALKGGEEVAYQGRKKRKTSNSLYLADRQGILLCMSDPIKGKHHDLYEIETIFRKMLVELQSSGIAINGLFMNADAGFDSKILRKVCFEFDIIPNLCLNPRNGERQDDDYFDEKLYAERYSIERSNAWIDSYRSVLNRFDTTVSSWSGWNYLAFVAILFKKLNKNKKSR